MFDAMAKAVRGQCEASPDFAQACHVQAVCETAEAAYRTGTRAEIQAPEDGES